MPVDSPFTIAETFEKLAIALALGLLVGIQRQRTESRLAGIRTFPLVTVLGTVLALLASRWGGWVLAAGFIGIASIVVIANFDKSNSHDPGITTEVTLLLMLAVGAYLVSGHAAVAVALVGIIALLLHLKPEMHAFVVKLGEKDIKAIMQFTLISLVILPVLPNRAYGPYGVLNPFKIWLLVVLIVGISLGGYVAHKFLGARGGSLLAGILGGLISSTATTVSYARRSRNAPESSSMAALVIMLASTVVFLRILILLGVTAPQAFPSMAGPIGAMFGATALLGGGIWLVARHEASPIPEHENPSEFRPALLFAFLFALVLLGVAVAKARFGAEGLYAVAALSGLSDMDAITLSTVQSGQHGGLDVTMAWRMILVAAIANLLSKTAIVAFSGSKQLLTRMALLFGLAIAAGLLILGLWPVPGTPLP